MRRDLDRFKNQIGAHNNLKTFQQFLRRAVYCKTIALRLKSGRMTLIKWESNGKYVLFKDVVEEFCLKDES